MATCTEDGGCDEAPDKFKESFKYFKRKKPPPDLATVLNFDNPNDLLTDIPEVEKFDLTTPDIQAIGGIIPLEEWKAYKHQSFPGFVFIANPFTQCGQQYWIKRCLRDFPCKPNITNLDAHGIHVEENSNIFETSSRRQSSASKEKSVLTQLRWATLGYHHDWNTKEYSAEKYTPFPDDLSQLSKYIAAAVGYPDYQSEAAIINFYHLDSTLSGHTDHSELDHESPLISVSFGQTAVFLLGGSTKAVVPLPVFLHSGDICIMSAESRLAYHAVPRILPSPDNKVPHCLMECEQESQGDSMNNKPQQTCRCSNKVEKVDNGASTTSHEKSGCICQRDVDQSNCMCKIEDFSPYLEYLRTSRINMNVRQVLAPGQTFKHQESQGQIVDSSILSSANQGCDTEKKKQKLEH